MFSEASLRLLKSDRLSICDVSMYTLIFAVLGIDSCQFSECMRLSESGPQCGFISVGPELWNAPKVHKQSLREQPEVG